MSRAALLFAYHWFVEGDDPLCMTAVFSIWGWLPRSAMKAAPDTQRLHVYRTLADAMNRGVAS